MKDQERDQHVRPAYTESTEPFWRTIMANVTNSQAAPDGGPAILRRIRAEYTEMPGLTLTLQQAARLWDLDIGQSSFLLGELAKEGFLVQDAETGAFRRPSCPACVH